MKPLTRQCSQVRLFVLGVALTALALFGATVPPLRADALPPAHSVVDPTASNTLLQFTSQGHLLGFSTSEFYISNATYALRVEFLGAHTVAPASDTSSTSGERGAPPLGRVTYSNLWDGITLAYDAARGLVSSSYRLEPQADPGTIHLRYNVPVTLNPDGSLTAAFASGRMTESAPQAWQEMEGTRVPVSVAFAVRGDQESGFAVGAYDATQPLFIDPTLVWTTFLGTNGNETGYAIAIDASGNTYVAGSSGTSWGSPLRAKSGGQDVFVAKLASTGNLTWNTFLGGSGTDGGTGIGIDSIGNVYVTGYSTAAWGAPVRAYTSETDTFVAKLTSAGALTWNTFLGGSGDDRANAIAVDASGNAYIAGTSAGTWESPVRAYGGSQDAFAAKLNTNGALTWNTFLGSVAYDEGTSIAVDGTANVYVVGTSALTWESPIAPYGGGASDAFAAKLTTAGALTWNTFLGGSGGDAASGIALDASNFPYVTGSSTATWGSPVRAYNSGYDGFVAKLMPSGSRIWNTFLGGIGTDKARAIAFSPAGGPPGSLYVVGTSTATWSFPTRAYSAGQDAFAAKLNLGGGLLFISFLGGSGNDVGLGVAADGAGNAYVAGDSKATWAEIPIQGYSYGGSDAFVAKLDPTLAFTWYTFLGANGNDSFSGIAVDASGNVYVAGASFQPWGLPVDPGSGFSDGFVAKLNSSGNLIWNTFIGGAGTDEVYSIAVDASGNAFLAGETDVSWGSPVRPFDNTSPGPVDGFAAKLDPSGGLLWNTFLGGPGFDLANRVAVDAYGNLYIAGTSTTTWESPKRAFTPGAEDAFAAKLGPNGVLIWNTFLGGAGRDYGYGVAVDSSGNVGVGGESDAAWGSPMRAFTGGYDVFAARLNGNGVLMWHAFLGGSGDDYVSSVAVDIAQNIYVGGSSGATWGTPIRSFSGGNDAFAAKLNTSGVLQWNTFLGGSGDEHGFIALDGTGNIYVGGYSTATWGLPIRPYSGSYDAFASKLTPTGALVWNTFVGGNGADCGRGIAADLSGNVYIGGHRTLSPSSGYCGYSGDDVDVFVAKVDTLYPSYVPFIAK